MSMIVAMMMKMTSEAGVSFHWVAHRNKNRRRCVRNYPFTKGIKVSRPDDEDGGDKTHMDIIHKHDIVIDNLVEKST